MKTFYDIHTHAFDLSHPNLSVFLQREDIIDSVVDSVWTLSLRWLLPFASLMPKNSLKKLIHKKAATFQNQLTNTLAFFEIPMEYQFLVMDYFLKNGVAAGESPNLTLTGFRTLLGFNSAPAVDETYPKIVLCPLVIDFGHKNIASSAYYNLTPKTPIAGQVSDLFYARKGFCTAPISQSTCLFRTPTVTVKIYPPFSMRRLPPPIKQICVNAIRKGFCSAELRDNISRMTAPRLCFHQKVSKI